MKKINQSWSIVLSTVLSIVMLMVEVLLLPLGSALAEEPTLEDQLNALNLPSNQAPGANSTERLYAVQTRYSPLAHRQELSFGGGRNFGSDSIVANEADLTYRYHLTDRWSLALTGSAIFNSLSSTGERILQNDHLLPDATYTRYRTDLSANANVFYGKFRLGMDRVFYFDQYVGLGAGYSMMERRNEPAAVGDVGFVFWMDKFGSVRVGLKDYFHREQRRLSSGMAHDLIGHIDVGMLFGGGRS